METAVDRSVIQGIPVLTVVSLCFRAPMCIAENDFAFAENDATIPKQTNRRRA